MDLPQGPCPLCGRTMIPGPSLEKHHPIPRSLGGREVVLIHRVCHRKIHSLFTHRELQILYHDFDLLRDHPEIQKFVRWIRKKPPEFVTRHRMSKRRGELGEQ